MRLAVVLEQLLSPTPGGTGRFARELTGALAGVAPEVIGWTAWHRVISDAQVESLASLRRLPLGPRALALAWERGLGPVPRGADVVLAPTLLMPPRRACPVVVTIHDAVPWTHPGTLTPRGVAFHRRMGERAAREADAILVPTRAVVDELGAHLSLRAGRVHVVGEGVSDAVVTPPADAVGRRTRLGLPADYLLTVSTLEPRKGLDIALDALRLVPDLTLVVVGQPGWGGVDLTVAAAGRGLAADRVRALGRIDDPDLAAVLAGATALVAPSRVEGFGLPVLEAMAAGVPVVCSDVPAFVEVTAGAALVVPVADADALAEAYRRVVADAELRSGLTTRGRLRAADFSWRATAERVLDVVAEVAGPVAH